MKKWVSLILAVLLTVSLAACVPSVAPSGTPVATDASVTQRAASTPVPTEPYSIEGVTAADYRTIEDPGTLTPYEPESAKRADRSYEEMVYTAPDAQVTIRNIHALLCQFSEAKTASHQVAILREIDTLTSNDADMVALAGVQFSMDTTSAITKAQQEEVQEYNSQLMDVIYEVYTAVLQSPFYEQLEAYYGTEVMDGMRRFTESYTSEIAQLQLEIDKLTNEYSTFRTEHSGEKIPLSGSDSVFSESDLLGQLLYFGDDPEQAYVNSLVEDSLEQYYNELSTGCNDIFDQILALRNQQALLAGYTAYPQYAIATSSGSYTYEDILELIASIKTHFVPLIKQLKQQGADAMDEEVSASMHYLALCPSIYVIEYPDFSEDEQLIKALDMVSSVSEDAADMAIYLSNYDLLQVYASSTKQSGAYTTYFNGYKEPLVYADSADAFTLVHELGHALNYFLQPEPDIGERFSIGTEIAEVHSMGMEMLCMKYYDAYYGDYAEEAEAYQIFTALSTILQQTMYCEFEFTLYENPNLSATGRAELFQELAEEYGLSISGNEYLNDGRTWVEINHFFTAPIYVQDYTLAQTVALELWEISREDYDTAVGAYNEFLEDSQELNLSLRLEKAGLSDPLEKETLSDLAERLSEYFASDDYCSAYGPALEIMSQS